MSCTNRITYCPLCRMALSAEDIAASPPGEYPSHHQCRMRQQEEIETMDVENQQAEFREREAEQKDDEEECST